MVKILKINKKGELSMETIFYILMGVVFVGLLIFGFNKIFFAQETISNQEKQEIRIDIENAFEKCLDPLNRGSVHYEKIKHKSFNAICILGTNLTDENVENYKEKNPYNLNVDETKILYDVDYNTVMIKADYFKDGQMQNPQIIDQIKLDNDFTDTVCYYYNKSKNAIELEIKC